MKYFEDAVRSIASHTAAQDVLQALLRGLREAAPRGAIYLVRPDGITGWSSFGYPSDSAHAQRAFTGPPDEGWLGRLAAEPRDGVVAIDGHGGPPAPDSVEAAETMGAVVHIQDKVVAILVGQRAAGEEPWCPYTLGALVAVAQLRLELSLAERRAEPARPQPAAVGDDAELSPVTEPPEPSPRVAAAQRFARLVATDIRLYNEEAVVLGRRDGDLVDRLRASLDRGRESFLDRHADLGDDGLQLLREAYVQVLGGGEDRLFANL